jgi:hypothetical protein
MALLRLKAEKIITSMFRASMAHRYHQMVIRFNLSQSQEIKAQEQSTSQLLRKRPRKILDLPMTESTAQVVVKKLFLESLLIEAVQKNRFAPIVLQQ